MWGSCSWGSSSGGRSAGGPSPAPEVRGAAARRGQCEVTTSCGLLVGSSRLDTTKLSVAELLRARVRVGLPVGNFVGSRVIVTYAPSGAAWVVPTAVPLIAGAFV